VVVAGVALPVEASLVVPPPSSPQAASGKQTSEASRRLLEKFIA